MNLSIVIPAYNEESSIASTLLNIKEALGSDCGVIVVDDYSCDNTFTAAGEVLKDFPQSRLIKNPLKKGFANALKTGFDLAQGDVVIPVMADNCDEIIIIPRMYRRILEGYDIVCASRYIKGGRRQGGPILKGLLSRYGSWIVHKISKIPVTDLTNSFKAYRKSALENISISSSGFEISMEIVLKAYLNGYRICEIPTVWQERILGRSHFSIIRDGIKFVKLLIFGLAIPLLYSRAK